MPPPTKDEAEGFLTNVVLPMCSRISALAQGDPSFSEKEMQGLFAERLGSGGFKGFREHGYKHLGVANTNETMDLFVQGKDFFAAIELKVESGMTGKFGGETALNAFLADMQKLRALPAVLNPSAPGKGNEKGA